MGVCTHAFRYGLGQTYELLRMPFYALHYYRKTTVLRPYDARMWRALASCYEALDRPDDAIKCLERAVCHADRSETAHAGVGDGIVHTCTRMHACLWDGGGLGIVVGGIMVASDRAPFPPYNMPSGGSMPLPPPPPECDAVKAASRSCALASCIGPSETL